MSQQDMYNEIFRTHVKNCSKIEQLEAEVVRLEKRNHVDAGWHRGAFEFLAAHSRKTTDHLREIREAIEIK